MKKKKGTNVYEKKITLGRALDGTPVRKSITGRTIAELNERIEYAKQKWMEMNSVTDGVLFATYARRWLTLSKAVKSLNTRAMYENIVERHLVPEMGSLYFQEITLADLQRIINARAEHYNTCSKIKLTLKQIYESAINEGIAKDIKVKNLVLPPKTHVEKRALTKDETDALFKADFTAEQKVFVYSLYYMGLRREEALALRASDIVGDSLKISRSLVFDKNTPVLKDTPKTSAGFRTIPIPEEFVELKEYAQGKDILFPMQTSQNYMSQSAYTKFWTGISKAMSQIEPSAADLTAYNFRHNYATMLYYSNVSLKMAARLMGHEGTQMIMQVYAHLDEEQERAAEKLNAVFKKRTPQP